MSLITFFIVFVLGMALYKVDALISHYKALRALYDSLHPTYRLMIFIFLCAMGALLCMYLLGCYLPSGCGL